MKLKPIQDQVVVIFGASSGIGRLAAKRFAARGAKVAAAARGKEGLESLVQEIRDAGGTAAAFRADAADFTQVQRVADETARLYGRIDTWVHLAAVSVYARFEETAPDEFERVIAVNLLGQIHGALAALPHLRREGRGALIHVSSVEAKIALPYQSAYAASKHGMHGFLKALRMELQHEGLPMSVTEIMPASVNTPFFNKARTRLGAKPRGVPPVYPPEMVAAAILRAAEHPVDEIVVGGAGHLILLGDRLAPALVEEVVERIGFAGQKSSEPRSEQDPGNLYEPLPGFNRVEGDFTVEAALTRPLGRLALAGAALGLAALMAARKRSAG